MPNTSDCYRRSITKSTTRSYNFSIAAGFLCPRSAARYRGLADGEAAIAVLVDLDS